MAPTRSLIGMWADGGSIAALAVLVGWLLSDSGHSFGQIYLLAAIALSLRVGMLIARMGEGRWGARGKEQRTPALFRLTRELTAAGSLDEAAASALRQVDALFDARTALLLFDDTKRLELHGSHSLAMGETQRAIATAATERRQPMGRFTETLPASEDLFVPLVRAEACFGVFVIRVPERAARLTRAEVDFFEGFAAQLTLRVERELWRKTADREKLLTESERLHRTLLDSVSHELKTPLAVLRSASDRLETDDQQQRQNLTYEIRTATRRLEYLVANLLNQNRLESGLLKPQLEWCDVRDIISAARSAVAGALDGRHVSLEISDETPLIIADAALMEQVLANLLLNAAVHTPAGSAIRVFAGLTASGTAVDIAISDCGPGLPPEVKRALFQKFCRGHHARTAGVGLGLSIVRGFVEAQGGAVQASGSDEGGACFTVSLPHRAHGEVPADDC